MVDFWFKSIIKIGMIGTINGNLTWITTSWKEQLSWLLMLTIGKDDDNGEIVTVVSNIFSYRYVSMMFFYIDAPVP